MNKRKVQAEETRRKLIESAQVLFAQNGFKGTTVRAINGRVGLTEATLYHYFPEGKKDIFRVIVRENIKQILDDFLNKNEIDFYLSMPLDEILETAYLRFSDIINQHIDIIRIILRENEVRDIISREEILSFINGNEPWLKNILRIKYERGEIREFDFDSAAIAIDKLLLNHIILAALGIDNEKLDNSEIRKKVFKYFVDMWEVTA